MVGGKPKICSNSQGVNRNLLKLQGGKLKSAQITGGEIFHEGPKQKKIKLQG